MNTIDRINDEQRQFIHYGVEAGMRFNMCIPTGTFEGGFGVKQGAHSGNSLEFMEHRDYMAGDDLRQLDWGVYARTDKLSVKLYREEVNPSLDIVIDGSKSMLDADFQKANVALGIASLLATAGGNAGFSYKTWQSCNEGFSLLNNGDKTPDLWDGINFKSQYSPADSIVCSNPKFQHNGVRILISDLLWLGAPHEFLTRFSYGATAVIIIQVLADKDINPIVEGNVQLIDSETGESQELFMDSNVVKEYKERLARHQQSWSTACRETAAVFTSVNAKEIVKDWMLTDLINHEILRIL